MLSCESCLTRLDESVERRTALSDDVLAHLAQCSSKNCQTALLEYQLLESVIPLWKAALPGIDMTQQVVQQAQLVEQTIETRASQPLPHSSRPQVVLNTVMRREPRAGRMTSIVTVIGALTLCVFGVVQSIPVTPQTTNSPVAQTSESITDGSVSDKVTDDSAGPLPQLADTAVEAELREFGKVYGSWVQVASHKLTDTVSVVLLDGPEPSESSSGWFSEVTEQLEEPFESTLKFLIEEAAPQEDEQTFVPGQSQKEYFGFLWSKSESVNPLFTLMLV